MSRCPVPPPAAPGAPARPAGLALNPARVAALEVVR